MTDLKETPMPLTADTQTAAPPYAAAYLIHPDALDSVRSLLQASGLRISPRQGSDTQVPRYTIANPHKLVRRGEHLQGLLSERELQVLQGMAHGLSNATIGAAHHLSEDTIKTHARRLFKKLGAQDRAHAVAIGYERGILGGAT